MSLLLGRPDSQSRIVSSQITGEIGFQRVKSLQVITTQVQDQCGQQPGRAAIAVKIGVNRGELVVGESRDDRARDFFRK